MTRLPPTQNKIDSLATLLRETELPREERNAAMTNVEGAMTSLEDDYEGAVRRHEDEKCRLSTVHGPERVEREIPDFDEGNVMEKDIQG